MLAQRSRPDFGGGGSEEVPRPSGSEIVVVRTRVEGEIVRYVDGDAAAPDDERAAGEIVVEVKRRVIFSGPTAMGARKCRKRLRTSPRAWWPSGAASPGQWRWW